MRKPNWLVPFSAVLACFACVQAGEIISNPSFETLRPDGFPQDWERVGRIVEVSDDAHTGKHALRFERPQDAKSETGLNRTWKQSSGQQGKMLAVLKGGIRFWYKAMRSDKCRLMVYLIPMNATPLERTDSKRAAFEVPSRHVGDGQWHEGALKYDFTDDPKAKWVHVSVRLVGGPGEMLFDDVRYVERVGPQLTLAKPRVFEEPGSKGERCTVACDLVSSGDAPLRDATVSLSLPPGVVADKPSVTVPALAPDGEATLRWIVTGPRLAGSTIGIKAVADKLLAETQVALDSGLELLSFTADEFLLAPAKGKTVLRARVRNTGNAALERVTARIHGARGCRVEPAQAPRGLDTVLPGQDAELTWHLSAGRAEGPAVVEIEVSAQGAEPQAGSVRLNITSAVSAQAKRLAGCIYYRQGRGRVLGEVQVNAAGRTVTLARLPWLMRAAFRNPAGEVEYLSPTALRRKTDTTYSQSMRDSAGAQWTFEVAARELSSTVTRLSCSARCDQARQLLAFEGPFLYVGEGDIGSAKTEAVFAGLEWLERDELSSSTLDIDKDHPHCIRYVPHPNMVTIPFMSVTTRRGTVGLLWDVHHKWDGTNDRQQPVFASPARFEGRSSHLMGLMAPNVMTGLSVNERLAAEPYALKPGQTLTLTGEIYAEAGGDDPLRAMDAWFAVHRPDVVLPVPQGDYAKWLEFSMQAYQKSLYVPEENAWLPFLGGPSLWRKPGHMLHFCWDLLAAARVTGDAELAAKYRRLAEEQLALAQGRARAHDMGFDFAGVLTVLPQMSARAAGLMRAMDDQGAWRFDANRKDMGVFKGLDYHVLGDHDAAELGTCARKAYDVLHYARISGDADAYWAGVKSLEFMRRFRVPRAAQVWEVPVHTPDILAASDAVDAYLEAYRFSGEQRWLAAAKHWARKGLPFVYVWNDERYPWMRYGSIPVFGATWFRGSWFGRVVQWNGLRHAYALLKLHEYDRAGYGGLTWQEWARGITHSAIYQQSTEGENLALWPDAYGCIDESRAHWDFAPYSIIKNVCTLIGREAEPETVILNEGDERGLNQVPAAVKVGEFPDRVHVTSGAIIKRAAWRAGTLDLSLTYPAQESGYTLIVGVGRPQRVTLNGQALAESDRLVDADASCFAYSLAYASVIVRLTHDGDAQVAVEGVRYRRPSLRPKVATRIAFEFDDGLDGWQPTHDLAAFDVRGGVLVTRATGRDPYMIRNSCEIAPGTVNTIVVRMRVSAGASPSIYWTTSDSPAFAEDKVARFPLIADGQFHDYRVDVGSHAMWQGKTITGVRLDPTNGADKAEIGVDFMRGE